MNQHYIKTGNNAELAEKLGDYFTALNIDLTNGPDIQELVEVQKERSKTLVEMADQSRCFYVDFDAHDAAAAKKHLRPVVLEPLVKLREKLASLEDWSDEKLHQMIDDTAAEFDIKMGKIAQPLRVAITGGSVSPSIDATLRLIGKKRVIIRLDIALDYIRRRLTETGG